MQMRCSAIARRGQVTLEYFILFAVLVGVTVFGLRLFDSNNNVRSVMEDFVNDAANKIAQ